MIERGRVDACVIDFALTLQIALDPGAGSWSLRIESDFELTSPGGPVEVIQMHQGSTPGDVNRPINDLLHRVVNSARVDADGMLAVSFDKETSLKVPVCDPYEAWQLVGPGNETIVSGPGGGLSIFEPIQD